MPKRKEELAIGEYYHVFSRGVDKRDIFAAGEDFMRFFEGMRDFNSVVPIRSLCEYRLKKVGVEKEFGPPDPLVNIICYCLNPNHFHFILEQVSDRGIEKFMQRLGMGYAKYFNRKYERSGTLYQGPFQAVRIDSDEYLLHVSVYVNLNDRVHKLGHGVSKSSWREYVEGLDDRHKDAMCKKQIILERFKHPEAYQQHALTNLPLIQGRKELKRFFL